jgi:hypothetical protein
MPVTKKQKLTDNQVVRRRERRDDPGPPIGGLPGGDDMWVIVRSDDTDSENDLQEDEARAREAASRVVPLQLPSTPPSFALSSPSSSSSSQQGVKRKARPREDTVMDSDSGSDSSFTLTSSSSSSSSSGKRTSMKKKKKKNKRSVGRSSTSSRTVTVATPAKRRGKFVFDPDRDYKHYCEFDRSKCDYATDIKSHLNEHMDIHNGVRHACSKCDKTFSHKTSVHCHIRVVHENQKNIPCKQKCGKMFISKYKQNEHFDFHHNNKAWTCPTIGCSYQGESKGNCTAHIKRVHGGRGEPFKMDRI